VIAVLIGGIVALGNEHHHSSAPVASAQSDSSTWDERPGSDQIDTSALLRLSNVIPLSYPNLVNLVCESADSTTSVNPGAAGEYICCVPGYRGLADDQFFWMDRLCFPAERRLKPVGYDLRKSMPQTLTNPNSTERS
jgi:hypothetical protein